MKIILIFIGLLSLLLGFIGIFLPLLPTVPFVLLSVYLFARSSPRLYNWIMNHKVFGKYIRNYKEDKAIPLKIKITSITMLWCSILFSIFWVVNEKCWLQLILFCIATGVSIHILSFKTKKVNL